MPASCHLAKKFQGYGALSTLFLLILFSFCSGIPSYLHRYLQRRSVYQAFLSGGNFSRAYHMRVISTAAQALPLQTVRFAPTLCSLDTLLLVLVLVLVLYNSDHPLFVIDGMSIIGPLRYSTTWILIDWYTICTVTA